MVGDEESPEEMEKGPLVYQETKVFHSEPYLINVYDNTGKRAVVFEVYGMDTQAMLTLRYEYAQFDQLFRFNAELMNPNRKEGRFHWVIERLEIQTVSKDRRLKLGEKPTEEVSSLPIYETVRKIPTGRMDLKERQRLREQMDMLDIRRAENIAKKRAATKERFLRHLFALKEDDARRKEEQAAKIEEERLNRYKQKEDTEKQEEEALRALEAKAKIRRKAVEVREQRTEEQEEFELAQLRLRWKAHDAEKKRVLMAARERRQKARDEAAQAKAEFEKKMKEAHSRRKMVWRQLDDRVKRKQEDWLKQIFDAKAEKKRYYKMQSERNNDFLDNWNKERWPVFQKALQRTEERRLAREAEEEAVRKYNEQRAVPKKENKKAKKIKEKKEKGAAEEGGGEKEKKKKPKAKDEEGGEGGEKKKKTKKEEAKEAQADHVDKVLDEVEKKMRAEMEEEKRRLKVDKVRQEKIAKKEAERIAREIQHLKEVREAHRAQVEEDNRVVAERRLIMKEKNEDERKTRDKKKADLERLARSRQDAIEKLQRKQLARMLRPSN